MSDHTKALKAILSDGTIAFHAIFSKAFRSLPIGVFLSQGFFWQENAKFRTEKTHRVIGGKLFFTKTAKEWFEETSLSPDQQKAVRVTLCKQGVLIEKLTDNPAKLYFHIDFETLVSEINRYLGSGVSVLEDKRNLNRFKSEPSIGNNPKQDSDKILTYYNKESLDSFESEGERTPHAPETQNLKEEEKDSGLVAPGRGENPETTKAEISPLPKVAPKGIPPVSRLSSKEMNEVFYRIYEERNKSKEDGEYLPVFFPEDPEEPAAQFEVTAIASPTEIPGVTLVEAVPPLKRANTIMDAEKKILDWAAFGGLETVRYRHGMAKRKWDDEQLPALIAHYCSVYASTNEGSRASLLRDPVAHFEAGIYKYLTMQNTIDRNNQPGNQGQTRSGTQQPQSTLPKFLQNHIGK